ncbi:MAG: hypothetical protein OXG16_13095 [Rhodospirillales bacterium]|nr:hypothetical protein [Rhodospirillales bacterium]
MYGVFFRRCDVRITDRAVWGGSGDPAAAVLPVLYLPGSYRPLGAAYCFGAVSRLRL